MPSFEQPMPFADAASDPGAALGRARLRTGELLAQRGVYGYVWLDDNLVVRGRFGTLVDFIDVNIAVAHSVPALIGLEGEIKALRHAPTNMLRLPGISIVTAAGAGPRLNLMFHAFDTEAHIMMVVSPAEMDPNHAVELSRQIRGRLMAEAEVAAKSQELARTNTDLKIANSNLEQFAAIATHDLKAPMRALGYLADEVETAIVDGDSGRARQKLAELRDQAKRVSCMLSALLHYSSAGRSGASIESVDVRELIEEIVRSLPRGTVEVTLRGAWPRIDTLAAPLALTLRNLIDNSIKHHDRANGALLITCADAGKDLAIMLADDGPGIAPEHHASMFLPFRTLGGGEGEGMGLAIVQKMLDAVGGSIALESDPALKRGTTFTIRWPKEIAL
jgi:signal transduction histidine kinase